MEQPVKSIRNSTFIRYNVIFFLGSICVGLLNYLYYPVMGRLLHATTFGEVQTLFSLFAQIAIFLNVLGLLTINIVANYGDTVRRNRVILELEKLATLISLLLLILAIVGGTVLERFFRFGSAWPFVMLALAVLLGTPLAFRTGYLRGKQFFGFVSLVGIITSVCDLIFSVILVLAGFSTTGAIFGLALAQFVAFGFAAYFARRHGFTESLRSGIFRLPDFRVILPELRYSALVLVGSLAITGLYSIDTVAIKHYFDAHTAGLYAGISTVARIIFFATASVAQVLLPAIRLHQPHAQNRQTLFKSLLLLTAIGGGILLIFSLFPRLVTQILMGQAYLQYANLLPRLSLVIFIISILNLFIMYHMALRRYAIMLIVTVGIAVTFCFLQFNHQTLQAVIDSLLYGSLTMMAGLAIWMAERNVRNRR